MLVQRFINVSLELSNDKTRKLERTACLSKARNSVRNRIERNNLFGAKIEQISRRTGLQHAEAEQVS
jgi:hypothetical protein